MMVNSNPGSIRSRRSASQLLPCSSFITSILYQFNQYPFYILRIIIHTNTPSIGTFSILCTSYLQRYYCNMCIDIYVVNGSLPPDSDLCLLLSLTPELNYRSPKCLQTT